MKYMQNTFASYLKLLIKWLNKVVNHCKLTFFKAIEKTQHMIGYRALNRIMDTQNDLKWSYRSTMPFYRSMWMGGLKCKGNGATMMFGAKGWLA